MIESSMIGYTSNSYLWDSVAGVTTNVSPGLVPNVSNALLPSNLDC